MKNLMFASDSFMNSGNISTETAEQSLHKGLARVIAINLMCLVVFIAVCALATFGSLSLLLTFWNDHRATSMIVVMIAIVSIPGAIGFAISRFGCWQR